MIFIIKQIKDMKLYYYYSDNCKCCDGYSKVVDKLCVELGIIPEMVNIDNMKASHDLSGVPSVVLTNRGVVIYKSVGNLKYDNLIVEVKKAINGQ